jgi:hypothetical protein
MVNLSALPGRLIEAAGSSETRWHAYQWLPLLLLGGPRAEAWVGVVAILTGLRLAWYAYAPQAFQPGPVAWELASVGCTALGCVGAVTVARLLFLRFFWESVSGSSFMQAVALATATVSFFGVVAGIVGSVKVGRGAGRGRGKARAAVARWMVIALAGGALVVGLAVLLAPLVI